MIKKYIFPIFFVVLVSFLLIISFQYKSKTEAMVAVVESQITATSYQKPVIIESIHVTPGQEVGTGDTLVVVSRPDLSLDIDKKVNEMERLQSEIIQAQQNYQSKKALLRIETEGKVNRLLIDLAEVETKQGQQKSLSNRFKKLVGEDENASFEDSLLMMKIKSIDQEIIDVKNYASKEIERLSIRTNDETSLINKEIQLVERELESLKGEYVSLVKEATFDGIVGSVNVQLGELVPPYKTVLSLYEKKPTLIKAFMNEVISYPVNGGDEVSVVSENRLYSIKGTVLELGARITDFPEKIRPIADTKSYGQEVFIRIPSDNRFLNGEKVFVYPKGLE